MTCSLMWSLVYLLRTAISDVVVLTHTVVCNNARHRQRTRKPTHRSHTLHLGACCSGGRQQRVALIPREPFQLEPCRQHALPRCVPYCTLPLRNLQQCSPSQHGLTERPRRMTHTDVAAALRRISMIRLPHTFSHGLQSRRPAVMTRLASHRA
jgi:hypothetical protein